jgi:hypothetical protein
MGFDNFLRAADPHSPVKVFSSVPDSEFSSAATARTACEE